MFVSVGRKLIAKLAAKAYRDAYVEEHVKTGVAYQIRNMRERAGLSQRQLGDRMGKPQSVISRLEDPDYGKLSVHTLLEVASTFDVALLVKFVSFPHFLEETADLSSATVSPYDANALSDVRVKAGVFPGQKNVPTSSRLEFNVSNVGGRFGGFELYGVSSARASEIKTIADPLKVTLGE